MKFSREGMPESRGQVECTGEGFPEEVTHFCDQEGFITSKEGCLGQALR